MDAITLMAMVDRAIGSAVLSAGRPGEEVFKAQFTADREAVIDALARNMIDVQTESSEVV